MRDLAIRTLDIGLQAATLAMIVALACIVLMGVGFRYSGSSLIWYDEVSSVLLAWITFTGAALAVLRNAHLGFNGLLFGLPGPIRIPLFWLVEAVFIATFGIVVWAGWAILDFFGSETMTTLRFVPRTFVQGILPVAAAFMVLARVLTLPERLASVRAGADPESEEIAQEIARAEAELSRAGRKT
ncbi:TRAP transporter small permease [Litoreibacter arenae]|uniref:TRAP transporter small permease protein n=1 Tax=Litoreibacter arenae DSM 19593 TaxID=1123360 RepID=S9RW99_9RHOB|nr:TRAP transporter small permease subunit [Litoreibacter arenae]EPX78289.1 TRAP-type transport system, small permease component, predicted N-acetylneuraminate transporter [Litoreibacter arenae DSM 19593]